jgi:RecA/RadA recombinase
VAKKPKKAADELAEAMLERPKPEPPGRDSDYLSTGSTLMNLAFTGHPDRGYRKGIFYSFVGDSSSGKTVLALSAFAEASISPHFKNHRLIFDNAEGGALMDMELYFGAKAAKRIESPGGTKKKPRSSETLDQFYAGVDRLNKAGDPYVLLLDSMDAINPEAEDDVQAKKIIAAAEGDGKADKGSYGVGKAKMNSARLRVACNGLRETGSVLIIISQTRQRIGFGSQFNPKTYSGGTAIKFYSRIQLWTSIREDLKVRALGKDRHAGIVSQIKLTKNHVTGWEGKLELPILKGYGVDDVGSCVDFLVDEGYWKEIKGTVYADDFGVDGGREKVTRAVIEMGLVGDLKGLVADLWGKIEAASRVPRPPRYA